MYVRQQESTMTPTKKPTKPKKPASKAKAPKKTETKPKTAETGKPARKPRGKAVTEEEKNTLPDGTIIDLDSLDYGEDAKLTLQQKRFVFWYTYPDNIGFMCQAKAARLAGYSPARVANAGYKLMRVPEVQKAIKMVLDLTVKTDLVEQYHQTFERLKIQAHYNIADYYKKETRFRKETINGKEVDIPYDIEVLKDLDELTPLQLKAIDNVDYRSQKGIRVYVMGDRYRAMQSLIDMYNKVYGDKEKDGFDVTLTAEIIKERLSARIEIRKKNAEASRNAEGYFDAPSSLPQEE